MNFDPKTTSFIFFEGNIGAGKTSALLELKKNYKTVNVITEPLEKYSFLNIYESNQVFNILEKFYQGEVPAFTHQVNIISVMLEHFLKNVKNNCCNVIERSLFSAINVFSKMQYINAQMSKNEYSILLNFTTILKDLLQPYKVSFIVFDTPYNICYDRIQIRNRQGEVNIEKSFLLTLDVFHKKFALNLVKDGYKIIYYVVQNKTTTEIAAEIFDKYITNNN